MQVMTNHLGDANQPPKQRCPRRHADANILRELAQAWLADGAELAVVEVGEPWDVVAKFALEVLEQSVDRQAATIGGESIGRATAKVVVAVYAIAH